MILEALETEGKCAGYVFTGQICHLKKVAKNLPRKVYFYRQSKGRSPAPFRVKQTKVGNIFGLF